MTLTETLELADRIDKYIEIDAYITLKDHKDGFPGKIDSQLINPAKSNLGKISKRFLEDAVRVIRSNSGSNQWISSGEVIDWFQDLPDKDKLTFLKFDIVSFYPSITKKTAHCCNPMGRKREALQI